MWKFLTVFVLFCFVSVTSAIQCSSSQTDLDAIKDFWTLEKMNAAIPLDKNLPSNLTAEDPAAPNCFPNSVRLIQDLGEYVTYPLLSIGKVYFTLRNVNYVCSGSVGSDRHIWTAGHCVFDRTSATNAAWAVNFMFVPGFANNFWPFERYIAPRVCCSDQFFQQGWNTNGIPYDYAVAICPQATFPPNTFVPFTLAVNYNAAALTITSHGYPQAAPFNGMWNHNCVSPGCLRASGFGNHPAPVCVSCISTGGASGGPWVIPAGANSWTICGVNSWKYSNDPDNMYSPYFDSLTQTFWNQAQTVQA